MKEKDRLYLQIHLYHAARRRAKENGLEFTITRKDILIPDSCPVLLWDLERNTGNGLKKSPSLDRVDSNKGYTPDNIRVISWWANYLKSNLNTEQVESLLKYMKG